MMIIVLYCIPSDVINLPHVLIKMIWPCNELNIKRLMMQAIVPNGGDAYYQTMRRPMFIH